MTDRPIEVAVVGAGVAGLATAYNLQSAAAERTLPLRLTVFEAEPEVGGNLITRREGGYLVEWGPNGFLDSEPATLRLVQRLGLQEQLQRSEDAARRRFLLVGDRMHEAPLSPAAFLKTGLLSVPAKIRVLSELFVPPRRDLGRAAIDPSTDETVAEFGNRRLGSAFTETMLDPMVKGISGGDARRISLAAAFPRMVELERDHGGLFKALLKLTRQRRRSGGKGPAPGPGGILHSFTEGMQTLPLRLRAALQAEVMTACGVERLWRTADGWYLNAGREQHGPFAAVIDAAPAHRAAAHAPSADLRALLAGISYAPMVVISLGYARRDVAHALDGFGMLIPGKEHKQLLGVLWSSSIFGGRAPQGKVLLRCMAGQAGFLHRSDTELVDLAIAELKNLYGLQGQPERAWVIRWPHAIAQYEVGHLARLMAIESELRQLPGLFLTGSSYSGIAVNHCMAAAEKTAAEVLVWLISTQGKSRAADQSSRARE